MTVIKMSYICLISNKNGASISADSRLSARRAHFNHALKVFSINDLIFGITGLYKSTGEVTAKAVRDILLDTSVCAESRIQSAISYLKLQTKANDAGCSLLIAAKGEGGKIVCSVDIKDGKQKLCTYDAEKEIAVQNGRNSDKLSPLKEYLPNKTDEIEEINLLTQKRTAEAIAYDKKMKKLLGNYNDTVGGKINAVSLKW